VEELKRIERGIAVNKMAFHGDEEQENEP